MYISKEYSIPFFFNLFKLEVYSDDRENGEYKHFIDIKFLGMYLVRLCYRTGECNGDKHYYMGTLSKYNPIMKSIVELWDWFKGKILWWNCSKRVHNFWDKLGIFNRSSYYDPKHFDIIDNKCHGKFIKKMCDFNVYEWSDKGMKFIITIDEEIEKKIREDNYYHIDIKDVN